MRRLVLFIWKKKIKKVKEKKNKNLLNHNIPKVAFLLPPTLSSFSPSRIF